jgi:hypothetical protein
MGPFYLKGYQNSVNNLLNRLCVMVMEDIFSLKSMKIILVDAWGVVLRVFGWVCWGFSVG